MQDTWPITRQRVQDWRNSVDELGTSNGWELRRILSSSQFLPQIVQLTLARSPLQSQALSPEHHWAFGLDKLHEDVAIPLLLDVINEDLPRWMDEQAQRDAQQLLDEARQAAQSDGEPGVTGALEGIPLHQLMLRYPRMSIIVFTQQTDAPDSSPSPQD